MTTLPTPLRADARRNREQILAAADRVLAEQGADAPMEEIARAAGVGVGTLYRRFPDRDALLVAVARENLAALLAQVRAAEAEEPRAWDALVRSMSCSREFKLSMGPVMSSPKPAAVVRQDPTFRELRREAIGALTRLVEAAQREGTLRDDVGPGDVLKLFALVYQRTDALRGGPGEPGAGGDLAAQRALAVILDGLRVGPHSRLPGHPLQPGDLQPRG